jgi:hypothetical protein
MLDHRQIDDGLPRLCGVESYGNGRQPEYEDEQERTEWLVEHLFPKVAFNKNISFTKIYAEVPSVNSTLGLGESTLA